MNFFERQAQVKNQSFLLVVLFCLALFGIIAACSIVICFFMDLPLQKAFIYASLLVTFVVFSATLMRISELRKGGAVVAASLGARQLSTQDNTYPLQRLRNVVEEMAIAAGTTVPDIYIMEDEDSINAFASGFTTADAVITVTRGAVDKLNRDELQAVIAHEYSHILNGDMRMNLKLVGVLYGILVISLVGQKILSSRLRGKGAASVYLMALGIYAVGAIGLIFAKIIKASINRRREYLADACAVQYTRQNQGLIGAFKKIGGIKAGSTINNINGIEYNHMYFCSGNTFTRWMATHPPLEDRIRAIDPKFNDGELLILKQQWAIKEPNGMEEDIALGFDVKCANEYVPTKKYNVDTNAIIASVGTADVKKCARAQVRLQTIPDQLAKLARNNYAAIPILLALLYPEDMATQLKQDQILKTYLSETMVKNIQDMHKLILTMDASLRLPLASLTFPALRNNSPEKLRLLIKNIQALILADNHISIQNYCLGHMISVQINDFLYPLEGNNEDNESLDNLASEVCKLLSIIADVGQSANGGMDASFNAGIKHALPNASCNFVKVDSAPTTLDVILPKLNKLNPLAKQTLLESMIITIQTDNIITNNEADLLRLICAALHIPLPLLSNTQ